ncbi:MAG: MFS transporter [Chloroflexota bacterium]|nr:MFS transporter [Chloroflexota bacterium]
MASPEGSTLLAADPPRGIRGYGARTFSSLRIPDFRVLWIGNVGTMLGQWIQFAAQGYLVFHLTGSPLQVGAVGFVRGTTAVVVSPFAGTVTDRFSRRSVLMVMTAFSASAATLLAVLIVTHVIEVWMLYPLSAFEGFGDAINQPARQVMIYDVVGSEDLPNAVAVNSLGSNTMRIVGPSMAGALIGAFGIQSAFIAQALAYSFSVYATSRIKTRGMPVGHSTTTVLGGIAEGIRYARGHRDVVLLVTMAALPSLLVYPYVQFIPVFAKDVLGVGSVGFGFLASAVGYGSIVGVLLAANMTGIKKRGQILVWTTFVYMALVTAFALSNNYALSFGLLVVAGIANSVYLMFNQVMIQLIVDDAYRGRVLSLYVMVQGLTPFSALLMGALIDLFGAQVTVACFTGLASAIVLVIGITSPRLRQI